MWRWYAGTTNLNLDQFESGADGEPIFRSLQDVERFKEIGGGGTLPWYVPLADYTNYYGQPSFTVGVDRAVWEGIGLGWWYSDLGGGKSARPTVGQRVALTIDNTATGETKVTPDLTVWSGSKIPTLFNGDFEAGNMDNGNRVYFLAAKNSTPGWTITLILKLDLNSD